MTKLRTERLDEIANIKITEFSDGTDTANGAYQSVGSSEIVLMARQLLAYEQAAKNPVAWIVHMRTGDQFTTDGDFVGLGEATHGIHSTPLYAAPVLPKQPDATITNEGDITKIIKAAEKLVRCKGRYHSEQNYRALAALFGVTVPDLPPLPSDEAPAQPVSEPYKLKDAVEDIRNSGVEIDADKIKAERDALNSPVIPDGWKLVPIEPTENMIIEGFESEPDEDFSEPDDWEEYAAMSGCEQAAHRAKLCWAAMLATAPTPQKGE